MKKPVAMTLVLLLCSVVFTLTAGAVDAPHYNPAAGNSCGTCHTVQLTLGSTGYNNICQTCHRPGDPAAGNKPITLADAANPFGIHSTAGLATLYQTSHRWDGADTNPAAGAQPPVQGQMTTGGLRSRAGNQLACVRCHNQHDNSRKDGFLRMANDQDQLCRDCHRSRDVQSHTQGSHPIGINYAAKVAANPTLFNARTINANPANPTSNLFTRISSAGGTILCSTCHAVHFSDSRSSTVDGSASFAGLSSGDGYLLRTDRRGASAGAGYDSATTICTSCHANKKSHNLKGQNIQCVDCHGAHVGAGNNFNLIRRDVERGTTGSGTIFFRYTASYKNVTNTGVCQGCHAVPTGTDYPAEHSVATATANDCVGCHFHNSKTGSFSGACTSCHGYPPTTATLGGATGLALPATGATATNPGAHQTHAVNRWMGCNTCHNGYSFDNKLIDIGFSINSSNFKGFSGPSVIGGTFNGSNTLTNGYGWKRGIGTNGSDTNATVSCSVYCHGATLSGGSNTAPVWTAANQAICGSCHATTTIATGSHPNHLATNPDCGMCHTGATSTSYPYSGTSHVHVNGQVDVANGFNAATKSCSSAGCHADPYSSALVPSPVWGTAAGCAACHNGAGTFSGAGNAPATGSHNKHMVLAGTVCSQCHAGTVAGSDGGASHLNGTIDVTNGYPSYVTKHAAGSYAGACSAASCHADPYSSASVTSPVWGATAGCTACHTGSGSFSGTGGAPATGSHDKHLALSGATCSHCHDGASATSGGLHHIDGVIDVIGGYPANVVKHAAGSYVGTCSAASCHASPYGTVSIVTPIWGTTVGCAACHTGTGAFTSTSGAPDTGSHTKHMGTPGTTCTQCHSGASSTSGGSAHIDGDIDVIGGYPANVAKHAIGSYTGTCSTASCHASPYGTALVVTPIWGTTGGCASCHSGTGAFSGTGGGPGTGSHNTHMTLSGTTCSQCHSGASTTNGGSAHIDGDIDVIGGYPTNVAKHAIGSYSGTCSTASCHASPYGTFSVVTPIWGTTGGCASCHTGTGAFIGAGGGPGTGSHDLHSNLSVNSSGCSGCHTGAEALSSGGIAHLNDKIDVAYGYPANVTKHAAGSGYATCATATCHSNPYGVGFATTPVWGVETGTHCAACHNGVGAFTGTGGGPVTGSHNNHMVAGATCGNCHAGASAGLGGDSHKNGDVDVTGGYPVNVGKHAVGSYTGSCSTTVCHGSFSPAWGVNDTISDTCTKCHGTLTPAGTLNKDNRYVVAPGLNIARTAGTLTGTGQVSNDLKVGAHQTHLRFFNGFSNYSTVDYRCTVCHGPLTTSGTHANGLSAPTFQGLASKGMTPIWTPATVSCSNTYCHNPAGTGGTLNTGNAGTLTFVSWTSSSYLGDTAKTESNCNRCHKSPGTVAGTITIAGTDHATLTIASDCAGCHGHNGDSSGKIVGQRHMDGVKYGSGGTACNGCHSYDVADWATATHNYGNTTAKEGIGAHAVHIAWIKINYGITLNPTSDYTAGFGTGNAAAVCGVCHSNALTDHTPGVSTNGRNISFNGSTAFQFGATLPAYNGGGAYQSSSLTTPKTCSNLSCHYFTTPNWSQY